jgi:integrase
MRKRKKPQKPYPDFPLTANGCGYWSKKINGHVYYFGKWDDPNGALQRYLAEKDALHAGKKPRDETEGTTVKQLCNAFLNAKAEARDAGEIAGKTWSYYKATCDVLVKHLGKNRRVDDLDPTDFAALRKRLARDAPPTSLQFAIIRARVVFKFAYDDGLIDRPVRYGQAFKSPSKKALRKHRAEMGPRLFAKEEIRRMLESASVPIRAMILLGINCGFGNTDCGKLTQTVLDLDKGFVDFPRPKTGIPRRCALWPETVAALREALARKPASDKYASLVFLTRFGRPWALHDDRSPLSKEVVKLLKRLEINGRHRLGFYTLRHTFRTVADEAKDQPAVDFIMGHDNGTMASVYRETISDARLRAVADYVRNWLFAAEEAVTTPRLYAEGGYSA